jgi:hypothetical protein
MKSKILSLILIAILAMAVLPASAQDMTASLEVADQVSLNGTVTVPSVYSEGLGWMVIHIDNDGSPGPVIGATHLAPGQHSNVSVAIDVAQATPVLFAMLHVDDGEVGVYEFGTVEGADAPARAGDAVVVAPFTSHAIWAAPQFVDGTFTAANIVTDGPGWLAIHQGVDGGPGPVIGTAQLEAGNNADVTIELSEAAANTVFPMIHVDDGEVGVYEFGTVEGADGPVRAGDRVAVTGVSTVPGIAAHPQIVVYAENFASSDMGAMMGDMSGMAPTFTAAWALSDGPGWIAIHSDADGGPGPVAGVIQLEDGLNMNLSTELDPELTTPVLWPMLHTDDGEVGPYEFGTVEGADGPVRVDDAVVVFPVNVAPSFTANAQAISEDGTITIANALIDGNGWIAIHSSVDGGPGPVVGSARLAPGLNSNVVVSIDLSSVDGAAADQVFPMLHYDTGEAGVYEFGAVEGADGPVVFGGGPVVGPLEIQ